VKLNIDENKRFFLMVGIALGVVLLVWGYDSSIRQAAALTRERNLTDEEELEDTKDKFVGLESISRSRNEILKMEFMPDIREKLEFPDTLSQAPPEIDPAFHLRKELASIQEEAKHSADVKNMQLPTSGWDISEKIKKNNTPQEISELRLRLAATSAVVNACIAGGVVRLRRIEHKKAEIEVFEDTSAVVRRLPFYVEFEGNLRSVSEVMLAFQRENGAAAAGRGGFLETRACEISDAPGAGVLLVKVTFAVVRVLDRSQVAEVTGEELRPEKPSGKSPATGTTRRQRY
jgi:hypothetical protein